MVKYLTGIMVPRDGYTVVITQSKDRGEYHVVEEYPLSSFYKTMTWEEIGACYGQRVKELAELLPDRG